jgi:hypothetical protein
MSAQTYGHVHTDVLMSAQTYRHVRADVSVLPLGNFITDATVSPSHGLPSGHHPSVRPSVRYRPHDNPDREAPNVSPNTFLACNAFIYNDLFPIHEEGQSVCMKRFHVELAVDSGCHMELVIPKCKARQLGLQECGQHIIQGYGGANTIMQIYRSVLVCLVKDGKTFKRADLIPASRLDEEDGLFAGLRDVKSIEDVEMLEFGEQPSEDLSLPLKVTQYSPVKNKARQMPDAILGLRGLKKMRFTIDFEKSLLIPMCTTGFVSTTVDSSIQSCGSGLSDV